MNESINPLPLYSCTSLDQCSDSTLICRRGDPCIIQCTGPSGCKGNTEIDSNGATDLSIYCTNTDSCQDAEIKCGTGHCMLSCQQDDTRCNEVEIDIDEYHPSSFTCNGYCSNSLLALEFTADPTKFPTQSPIIATTINPTINPSSSPTNTPSISTSQTPTMPSKAPSINPTGSPTNDPTFVPTIEPSTNPSMSASANPTDYPSKNPTNSPSKFPTQSPSTLVPSKFPTVSSVIVSSLSATQIMTSLPSFQPTSLPIMDNQNATLSYESLNGILDILLVSMIAITVGLCVCLAYYVAKKRKLAERHRLMKQHVDKSDKRDKRDEGT